jgi:hypothetical protein
MCTGSLSADGPSSDGTLVVRMFMLQVSTEFHVALAPKGILAKFIVDVDFCI